MNTDLFTFTASIIVVWFAPSDGPFWDKLFDKRLGVVDKGDT